MKVQNSLHNLDGCFKHGVPVGGRRIAWDALSFCVPSNWELTVYNFLRRGVSRIVLEDEYSIRLEAEWMRGRRKLNLERIMHRYEEASKSLTLKADARSDVDGLPVGWHATHFALKETGPDEEGGRLRIDQYDLVTAFYLCPRSSIFCFFMLHFSAEDAERPAEAVRRLASTFQDHGGDDCIPWQIFDVAFKVPRQFVLSKTQFDIGVKLMVFTWKLRRFFLWHFSCADVFLPSGASPAEWACRYLNGARPLKGPVFHPDGQGGIGWRRRLPHFFGHREEIATGCFRYDVGCRLLEGDNKLVVWAYHYRSAEDLKLLILDGQPTRGYTWAIHGR